VKLSGVTGRDHLAELSFDDDGYPFADTDSNTGKCCATGTCDHVAAQGASDVESTDTQDPVAITATLGSLDDKMVVHQGTSDHGR
jgi:hypothetical protein